MLPELFTVLTFVLVFAIVFGSYWATIVRTEDSEIARLRSRVVVAARTAVTEKASLVKEITKLSAIEGLNALLAHTAFFVAPLQRLIDRSHVRTSVGTVLLGTVALFVAGFLLAIWFTGSMLFGSLVALAASTLPFIALRIARQRLLRKLEEQLPEAMDLIARSLRAGHAFATGLKLAADEIPEPLGAEFRALHDRHSFGQPMPQALREFADRVELIDARFFVTAVLTQREAGGNLAEVLDHLSWVIRDRFRIKREVRTKSAHGRMSGIVIASMPPLIFLYSWITNPERVANFVSEPTGANMLIGAFISQVIGMLVIRQIVNIRY